MFGGHHRAAPIEEDEEQELVNNGTEEEEVSRGPGRKILVGVLAVGAVVALGATASSSVSAKVESSVDEPRFLQSDDLLDTIAAHAVRFQQEMGGEVVEGDHEELKGHARRSIAEMAEKVSSADVSSGRLLKDLNLNDEQWFQSKQILEALHDKKVQDLGNFVQSAVRGSGNMEEAAAKVAEREEEFRALRDHYVPPSAQDVVKFPGGENHWSMGMSRGELEMSGSAAGWSGSLSLGGEETARRLLENATTDRRLMTKQQMIYLIVTAVVVGVLGIVLTILTATLGAQAATILFLVGAGLDGVLCAGSVGLTFIPGFKNFNTWIPCVILSTFTGLEAIWTFRKPRCSHTCPNSGKIINNRCYFAIAGAMNFQTAQAACSGRSATLASARDQKDVAKIQTVLTSSTDAWIGATRTCPVINTAGNTPAVPTAVAAGNAGPAGQKPNTCTNAWSWTDGTAWFAPVGWVSPNTYLKAAGKPAVGKPSSYTNLYFKAATPTFEPALDTDTKAAVCELWMCR